jgi:glycosyltransferase involved in cell wall biosynthesis
MTITAQLPTPRPAVEPLALRAVPTDGPTDVLLDLVVPVHNEERALADSVRRLHSYLESTFPYRTRITIADNASTDATLAIAHDLADELPDVDVLHLAQKGRGRALRAAWSRSPAPVLAYLDVDLSTDLAALLPLVAPLVSGHSDLAIGTRLARGARIVRGPKREVISRCYNLLLRGSLRARFSDAQCGFKAIRKDVAQQLLPLVEDEAWFFDTELLVLAERSGLRIHEVPVDWVDDPDSRVDIVTTALDDLRGVARVGSALVRGRLPLAQIRAELGREPLGAGLLPQLLRFVAIGAISTAAYVGLFVSFRGSVGAQVANLLALLITAVANTAANRRLTFGVRGREGAARHQGQGLVVFGIGLALTSGSLAALHAMSARPAAWLEIGVLVTANLAATLVRFVLLRRWVFTLPPRQPHTSLFPH